MKFDILEGFQVDLMANMKSPNTARRYYSAVKQVFSGIQFNTLQDISKEQIEQRLSEITGKSNFSAAKRGLELLKEYDPNLNIPDHSFFATTSIHKRNHKKKSEPIKIDTVKRKINQISDTKLKLAYRLMIISGLRVFEVEALTPQDIKYENGIIYVQVEHGKGDKARRVECIPDKYVYGKLQEFTAPLGKNEKMFYSEETMRRKAHALGIECHNLRRIYAHLQKEILKKEGTSNYEANKVVQSNLGHVRYKTTKRYLYGRKFIE